MILSEPPRTRYDLNFGLLGIPVRVHPLFWLVAVLLGARGNPKPREILLWVVAVFVSILVHELGHALAARAYGWPPWITLYSFGGLASYRPTYRNPINQIAISLAGPGAGFVLAAVIVGLIAVSGHHPTFGWRLGLGVEFELYRSTPLNYLLYDLLFVNIFWGLVNLLPIVPLDGGQISLELFAMANPRDGQRQALWLSIIVAVAGGAFALVRLDNVFLALFCGYLAYTSYATMQATFGSGGGWGGFR